jgi:hypothetical protein
MSIRPNNQISLIKEQLKKPYAYYFSPGDFGLGHVTTWF